MIQDIGIAKFRCFRSFQAAGLTRVNLFVGKNNAGKTSLLEALELLSSNTINALVRSAARRGEYITVELLEDRPLRRQYDLSHLFYGHLLAEGMDFTLRSTSDSTRLFECTVSREQGSRSPISKDNFQQLSLLPDEAYESELLRPTLRVHTSCNDYEQTRRLPLSAEGGVSPELLRRFQGVNMDGAPPVNFLGTREVDNESLLALWDSVVLTPEEDQVVQALRLVESGVERLAFVGESRSTRSVFLKMAGTRERIPLGSAGDGMKRLLALALHLIPAAGGALLVDEIDTGLHYTVLTKMWDLVVETAVRLNIQVFATTHSLDCVLALAGVHALKRPDLVSLHRIDNRENQTVRYSANEIEAIADARIEVR